MHRGYVKFWRKITDSGLLQNGPVLQVFCYLVTSATHKDTKTMTGAACITLSPGQIIVGRKKLAIELKLSEQQIRTALSALQKMEIINQQPTNKYTIVSIVNWETYQDQNHTANQQVNQQSTSSQPTTNQQLTTKQECKNKRMKEEKREEGKKAPPPPPEKLNYGENANVLLTEDEYSRLCAKYGTEQTSQAVILLDLHIGAKGKDDYKSHYLAMQKWVFDAVAKRAMESARASPQQPYTPKTYAQAQDLERRQRVAALLNEEYPTGDNHGHIRNDSPGIDQARHALTASHGRAGNNTHSQNVG